MVRLSPLFGNTEPNVYEIEARSKFIRSILVNGPPLEEEVIDSVTEEMESTKLEDELLDVKF
jgi:hypothetical protein